MASLIIASSVRKRHRPRGTVGWKVFVVLCLALAPKPVVGGRFSSLESTTLRFDNDILGGTDSRYTSGYELILSFEPWQADNNGSDFYNMSLGIGQAVFTPRNVRSSELVSDDRPYAGWSYLTYGFHHRRRNVNNTFALNVGIVGPSSGAEDLQKAIHELIGDHFPNGWKNQLHDELGIVLSGKRDRRMGSVMLGSGHSLELFERIEWALGNVDTSASAGFLLQYGRDLPDFLSIDRIGAPAPRLVTRLAVAENIGNRKRGRFHWMCGAKVSFVARNIFLDGNRSGLSHRVYKHNVVAEAEFGFAYSRPSFRFSMMYVYRTAEFERQDGGQGFGALSVTFRR